MHNCNRENSAAIRDRAERKNRIVFLKQDYRTSHCASLSKLLQYQKSCFVQIPFLKTICAAAETEHIALPKQSVLRIFNGKSVSKVITVVILTG